MSDKSGGAFPSVEGIDPSSWFNTSDNRYEHTVYSNGGLTKRELFAAMIFAQSSQDWINAKAHEFEGKTFAEMHSYCAQVAVMRADALLEALADRERSELAELEREE